MPYELNFLPQVAGVVDRTHASNEESKMRLLEEEARFDFRDTVSCHVGQDNWVSGVIMAKNLYMTRSDRAKTGVPYDAERWESNYEAYQVSAGHTQIFCKNDI